jgi:limonene-1,2-epoxide hydrolase
MIRELRSFVLAVVLVLALALAGCDGEEDSPKSVVRGWIEAVNAEDNLAAANYFARGARIEQGELTITLRTRRDALEFNEGLPCSAEIVKISSEGATVTADFLLSHAKTSRCDGPGATVTVVFRVRDGKIVLWRQLPAGTPSPPPDV